MLPLTLYLIFPWLCILAISPARPRHSGSAATRLVYGVALYEFLALVIGLALGFTHRLTAAHYTLALLVAAVPLARLSFKNGLALDTRALFRWAKTRRGLATLLSAALVALVYGVQLLIDARFGTKHYDGLWYHIPRVIFWLQQGNFEAWQTPVWSQIGLPLGADIVLGQKILLGSGWLGIGYVSCVLSLGAVACVYLAALDLGLSRWHGLVCALLFAGFPATGLRIWSVNSDITAAFPVLASYVVLRRLADGERALAIFIVLNGMGIACKQTVVFHAALLGGIVLWRSREKVAKFRSFPLAGAAVLLASSLVLFSFLPIYRAFGDLNGGDMGRDHKVSSLAEFNRAAAMHTVHWLLEPLGYLTPVPLLEAGVKRIAKDAYNLTGAKVETLPEAWKPWPAQDIGRSGLVPVLLLPLLLAALPAGTRLAAAVLFALGFVPLSGILHFQPWFARYHIVLLAGYALIWCGTGYFRHGLKRWLLIALAALNVVALLGVVAMRFQVDRTVKMKPGGPYYYLSDADRSTIAASLQGRPLQVITDGALDALIVGPQIGYRMKYLMFPAGCDLDAELLRSSRVSNWIAIVHEGDGALLAGPQWHRLGIDYRRNIAFAAVEKALHDAGWRRYKQNNNVDLWETL